MPDQQTDEKTDELTGKELRDDGDFWTLLPRLERKEKIAVCQPNPPNTDKLSALSTFLGHAP